MTAARGVGDSGWRGWLRQRSQRRWLRDVNDVGDNVRCDGRPTISNHGRITLGSRVTICSHPSPSHLVTIGEGVIDLGNDVHVSYGGAISARVSVRIGPRTVLGPYCTVMDSDFHSVSDRKAEGESAPIVIGADVMIGARVTLLRGAMLGDGCTVASGSMVSGAVAAGTNVAGVPARQRDQIIETDNEIDVQGLAQRILGLAVRPGPGDSPATLPEWDSLGALRLLLAIEDEYRVALRDEDMKSSTTLAQLARVVADRHEAG